MILITADLSKIDFAPASLEAEVMQNVKTILNGVYFSTPYYREFSLNPEYLDMPINMQQALIAADVTQAIQKYEPRVIINEFVFSGDTINGQIIAGVKVSLKDA